MIGMVVYQLVHGERKGPALSSLFSQASWEWVNKKNKANPQVLYLQGKINPAR